MNATNRQSPLPWKITNDGMEWKITDANGCLVIYGNVNRGIEFDDPMVPGLVEKAIAAINLNHQPNQNHET